MKRNLIAASMGLSMLLALCGCGNTGSVDSTVSPDPTDSAVVDDNNGSLPNNAGGTANNDIGASEPPDGPVTDGSTAWMDDPADDNGAEDSARYGNYHAGRNGSVAGSDNTVRGAIRDAGDSLRGAARDAGNSVRNAVRDVTGG